MVNLEQNILYISFDGMTDPLGQSQVLPYIFKLSKTYKIHLISFEKKDRFQQEKDLIYNLCEKNNIEWHPISYSTSFKGFSSLYNIKKMFNKAEKLQKRHHFKIIHCRSYISALVGLKFKRKYNTRFLFDMRGFWTDERVEGKIWNLQNPIHKLAYRYFKKKEKAYFQESDAIVSLTNNGKEEILSWQLNNVFDAKITVIPCCVDIEFFVPNKVEKEEVDALKAKLGINEKEYVLGYVGSIGTWYMLSEMLDYFKVLSEQVENTKLVFITTESKEKIKPLVQEKGIPEEKVIVTKCLHKDVPKYISTFDSSVFFIQPTYSKKASSPTKQGELMAMGIPVVCNTGVGDTDEVIKMYESGVLVNDFTEEAYKKAVLEVIDTNFDKEAIKQGASMVYGLDKGVASYFNIYKRLING